MKKLSFVLALLLSNLAFAATTTYTSGLVPVNGTYNIESEEECALDFGYSNSPATNPPITGWTSVSTGYWTSTPDATIKSTVSSLDAYNKWLASIKLSGPTLSQVTDPTDTTKKLTETPIQWGPVKITSVSTSVTKPYSTANLPTSNAQTGFGIETKFTFSNPALNNGITTGYMTYVWLNGGAGWAAFVSTPNAFSTSPTVTSSTNILGLRNTQIQNTFNNQAYTYNCLTKVKLSR